MAVQPDGKIIVVGSSAMPAGTQVSLVRYLRDGGVDTSFGKGGKVITAVGRGSDAGTAVALQADGKIVVAGRTDSGTTSTGYDFMLLRYNSDGSADTRFGNAGKVVTDFNGKSDVAHAILIQPDGKIVVGGESLVAANTTGWILRSRVTLRTACWTTALATAANSPPLLRPVAAPM